MLLAAVNYLSRNFVCFFNYLILAFLIIILTLSLLHLLVEFLIPEVCLSFKFFCFPKFLR